MPDANLEKQVKLTYLKMIENSPGTKIFNSAYVKNLNTGQMSDILNDGEFSCAFFVSSILALVGLMDRPHSTVKTVVSSLSESEKWQLVKDLGSIEPGDVVVWETVRFEDGSENEHIGFYLGAGEAVSTSYLKKEVVRHPFDFNGKRKVVQAFRPGI